MSDVKPAIERVRNTIPKEGAWSNETMKDVLAAYDAEKARAEKAEERISALKKERDEWRKTAGTYANIEKQMLENTCRTLTEDNKQLRIALNAARRELDEACPQDAATRHKPDRR